MLSLFSGFGYSSNPRKLSMKQNTWKDCILRTMSCQQLAYLWLHPLSLWAFDFVRSYEFLLKDRNEKQHILNLIVTFIAAAVEVQYQDESKHLDADRKKEVSLLFEKNMRTLHSVVIDNFAWRDKNLLVNRFIIICI